MSSKLERLAAPDGPLAIEPPDEEEFQGLKRSGLARLADAHIEGLSLEGRFDLAYNAAHALCLAALRAKGFRAKHRYIVFQALPQTLELGPEVWRVLAKSHDIRNRSEYEGGMQINKRLVEDLLEATEKVAQEMGRLKI